MKCLIYKVRKNTLWLSLRLIAPDLCQLYILSSPLTTILNMVIKTQTKCFLLHGIAWRSAPLLLFCVKAILTSVLFNMQLLKATILKWGKNKFLSEKQLTGIFSSFLNIIHKEFFCKSKAALSWSSLQSTMKFLFPRD